MAVNKYNDDERNTEFSFKQVFRILKYLKLYKLKIFIVFILSLLGTFISLIVVKLYEYIIDVTIPNENIKALGIVFVIIVICYIFNLIKDILRTKLLNTVSEDIILRIREDLFKHIQYLSFDFYNTRPHGKILIRLTDYAADISFFITHRLIDSILDILSLSIVLIFMFTTNATLSFIIIIGVILMIIIYIIITPKKRKYRLKVNNKRSNMNAYQLESIKGILTTQSFNREEYNTKLVNNLNTELNEAQKPTFWIGNLTWVTGELIVDVLNLTLLIIGILWLQPNISVGVIVAMVSYSKRFYGPINRLFRRLDQSVDTMTYLERVFELLDEEIEISDKNSAKDIDLKGRIEFKNVKFGYSDDSMILDNVSFIIEPNQKVAIVGETGSGKTTITNLLARFYDKNEGEILLDENEITEITLKSLRRNMTVMLQDSFLFTMSIYDNLTIGNSSINKRDAEEICKKMEIHDWIMTFDDGYNTILKNGGQELSQGQRQLLCYARTVIANPKILILDEATSKIDTKTEKMIERSLEYLFKNRTVIVIAHRLSTIIDSDKIMLVKNHKIYEEGTHHELMRNKDEYYRLYMASTNFDNK